MGRKPSSGATPVKHARAWVEEAYPRAATWEAHKGVVWIWDKETQERRPISHREDLFGCFDLLVLRSHLHQYPLLIQVTTDQPRDQAVRQRKRKIEQLFIAEHPEQNEELWVIAWVARKGFKRWRWDWEKGEWERLEPLASPLIKRGWEPEPDPDSPW